jgi:hypothetical protein
MLFTSSNKRAEHGHRGGATLSCFVAYTHGRRVTAHGGGGRADGRLFPRQPVAMQGQEGHTAARPILADSQHPSRVVHDSLELPQRSRAQDVGNVGRGVGEAGWAGRTG